MPKKAKRFGSRRSEVRANCFTAGCGRRWTSRAAALKHAADKGHAVAIRTVSIETFGADWPVVLGTMKEAGGFTAADVTRAAAG